MKKFFITLCAGLIFSLGQAYSQSKSATATTDKQTVVQKESADAVNAETKSEMKHEKAGCCSSKAKAGKSCCASKSGAEAKNCDHKQKASCHDKEKAESGKESEEKSPAVN